MAFDLLTHGLVALLAAQGAVTAQSALIKTPRWSTYEMTLTATGHYDRADISVDLVGVFTGPDGQGILAKGFWDGGQTFRIRFTPTAEGIWTFTTVSDDRGLDGHVGSLTCVRAADGSHGFVRQSGAPRTWIHDDGAAVQGDRVPIRMHVPTEPCGQSASPCRDGDLSPPIDLAQLQAADRLVADALTRGRVAEIALFDRADGGIDGPALYRYVEYMAARYGAWPNVVWCLSSTVTRDRDRDLVRSARNLLTTLDPYFAGPTSPRAITASCGPAS
jgi:hypothetical protein